MVSGDRSAIISISGTRAGKDQSIHEWSKAPRISITGRHYHARKSRSLAAWWGKDADDGIREAGFLNFM